MKNTPILFLSIIFVLIFSSNSICYAEKISEHPNNNYPLKSTIPKELRFLSYAIYHHSSTYSAERFDFNKRFNIYPKAIIIPNSNEQLIDTLKILHKYNLNFSIRSGGHCFLKLLPYLQIILLI